MNDKITSAEAEVLDSDATALILNIMQQNTQDVAFTTNSLIENYKSSAERANAELAAIRWNVNVLFNSGYHPSQSAIMDAIWPTYEQIEDFMENSDDRTNY